MGSTAADDPDPRDELAALTSAFRQALAWHRRAGTWSAPGGQSPRLESAPVSGSVSDAVAVPDVVSVSVSDAVSVPDPVAEHPAFAHRGLAVIREDLGDCQRCKLCSTRTNIVFGTGPEPASLMFIGEAPGADEDRTGQPFVGRAGELLDKMIEAMGWGRDDVYIANVLKCRPPGNRTPEPDEIAMCRPFLDAQILAVRPRVIVTLGRSATNVVLGKDAPINTLRGKFHEHRGIRLMPTFHPAYLLRDPDRKRDTWSDLKMVIAELERLGVTSPRPPRS